MFGSNVDMNHEVGNLNVEQKAITVFGIETKLYTSGLDTKEAGNGM